MDTIGRQILAVGALILMGALIGLLFDVYRITRGMVRPKGALTALGDMAFWFISAGLTFWFLLLINRGEVRFYIFLALLAGFILYRFTFGKPAMQGLILLSRAMEDFAEGVGSLPESAFRVRRWLSSQWRGFLRLFPRRGRR